MRHAFFGVCYSPLLIMVCAGCAAAEPQIRLLHGQVDRDRLHLVIQTSTLSMHPVRGEQYENVEQFVVTYVLPPAEGRAKPDHVRSIPSPRSVRGGGGFLILEPGDRLVRTRNVRTVVSHGRAYARADIEVFGFDDRTGEWGELHAWKARPLLLSPCGTRLVLDDGAVSAYDVRELRRVEVPGLEELLANARSFVSDELQGVDSTGPVEFDAPPDYLGLTRDFDYGSADGGDIYAGFIYDRQARESRRIPQELRLPDSPQPARAEQVRKSGEDWRLLFERQRPGRGERGSDFFVTDLEGNVLHRVNVPEGQTMEHNWNAPGHAVLFWPSSAWLPDGALTIKLWRYGGEGEKLFAYRVDPKSLFEMKGNRYLLREPRLRLISGSIEVFWSAYIDAFQARDREKIRDMVLLPSDPHAVGSMVPSLIHPEPPQTLRMIFVMFSPIPTLAVIFLVQAQNMSAQSWHFDYKEDEKCYYTVEAGRLVVLVEIRLRETSNPFNGWGSVLVQPCRDDETSQERALPCWPDEKEARTQKLLKRIATELPEHRATADLLKAAGYINRGIGAFHPAWIVGTHPLTVAYRQGTAEPAPYADLPLKHGATTRPTTTPGVIEVVTRSGRTMLYDARSRRVELVSDDDLNLQADVVLMFPAEMHLPWGQMRTPSTTQPAPKVTIFYLREPMPLRSIMRVMTEQRALERQAERIEEVDVEPR